MRWLYISRSICQPAVPLTARLFPLTHAVSYFYLVSTLYQYLTTGNSKWRERTINNIPRIKRNVRKLHFAISLPFLILLFSCRLSGNSSVQQNGMNGAQSVMYQQVCEIISCHLWQAKAKFLVYFIVWRTERMPSIF